MRSRVVNRNSIALRKLLAPGTSLNIGKIPFSSDCEGKLPSQVLSENKIPLFQLDSIPEIITQCVSKIPTQVDTPIHPPTNLQTTTTSHTLKPLANPKLLDLNCIYTNATSLNSLKLAELQILAHTKQTHLVFVSETWFNNNSATVLQGYNTFNHDRTDRGGGVAIFSKSDLNASEATGFTTTISEQVWVQLTLANEKLLLGCIYRPPNASHQITNDIIKNIKLASRLIKKKNYDGLILTGDFNLPNIQWSNSMAFTANTPDEQTNKFLDLLSSEALTQNFHFPTFIKACGDPTNTLDYIISESQNRIKKISSSPPLGMALQGHLIIDWKLALNSIHQNEKFHSIKLNYKKGDYTNLSKFISSHDWPTLLENKPIEESYECFLSIYKSAIDSFIPKSNPNTNKKFRQPWMNPDLLQLVKLKKSLFNKNRATKWRHVHLNFFYHEVSKNLKKQCKIALANYEFLLVSDKLNPKRLYAYIKS